MQYDIDKFFTCTIF